MKRIQKHGEPGQYNEWKRNFFPHNRRQATWSDLSRNVRIKRLVKTSLLAEQRGICCYCCVGITIEDSHIEHIKPRRTFRNESLAYNNMLLSCLSEQQLIELSETDEVVNCGHAKENWYDVNLFVTPLNADCEEKFSYGFDGQVYPQGGPESCETIRRLHLDSGRLNVKRAGAIEMAVGLDLDVALTHDEIEHLINVYQCPKDDGHYHQFCTAIVSVLRNMLKFDIAIDGELAL